MTNKHKEQNANTNRQSKSKVIRLNMLGRTHITKDKIKTFCKRKIDIKWSYDSDNDLRDVDCKRCLDKLEKESEEG